MTTHDDTRTVAKTFFEAWTRKDERTTRALMADAIDFENPVRAYRRADELLAPFMGFAAQVRRASILDVIVEGERAMILWDCEMPEPIGVLKTVWFLRIEDGKVRTLRSVFDATEVRKVQAQRT